MVVKPRLPTRNHSSMSSRNTLKTSRSRARTRHGRCWAGDNSQISIHINVGATPREGDDIEVELKIEGKAEAGGQLMFGFELIYAGVFRIRNVPQESMAPVVLIECPRLLFPFAREIIATTVRNGGFPPLMLDPVDFVSLYRQRLSQMQPANQPAPQT